MSKKFSLLFLLLVLFQPTYSAQNSQKMVLSFRSEGSMAAAGTFGPASVTVKTEGFAYLSPGPTGKLSGAGEIYVTITNFHLRQEAVNITPLKGQGTLEVEGKREGKFLIFYFKPGSITCKGELIYKLPVPIGTKRDPFEQNFDPSVLAPGEKPGVKIEFKDGAQKTVNIGPDRTPAGNQTTFQKTDFVLSGVELWRVSVEGEELDTTQSPIQNPNLKNDSKELPIAMHYKWSLIGEFSVIGKGSAREYYEGVVFSANIEPVVQFKETELYRVEKVPSPDDWNQDDLISRYIGGKVSANVLRLQWPEFNAPEHYLCTPKKAYLGKVPHRLNFESKEFIGYISRAELPLKDGQIVTGGMSDWLKYRIKIIKLQ